MSRIRSKDTKPELLVRRLLHRAGYRFRIHDQRLSGKPDIVLPKYRTVIFVHGCYWHRHVGCREASLPKTNRDYWTAKFVRTVERDQQALDSLKAQGWHAIVLWECELETFDDPMKLLAVLEKKIYTVA